MKLDQNNLPRPDSSKDKTPYYIFILPQKPTKPKTLSRCIDLVILIVVMVALCKSCFFN